MMILTRTALTLAVLFVALLIVVGVASLSLLLPIGLGVLILVPLTMVNTWVILDILATIWEFEK